MRRIGWARLSAALIVAAASGGLAVTLPAAAATACQPWSAPQDVGSSDNFAEGAAVTSGCEAWLVGYDRSGTGNNTLIEQWNGSAWTVQPSPDPGTVDQNALRAVAATSPANAWAVGQYRTTAPSGLPLILHWDGTAWTQVTAPAPGQFNFLFGVAATSASDAWAVGESITGSTDQTLILHWDGAAWTQVPSPSPAATGVNFLTSVSATSATNAWASGYYFNGTVDQPMMLHWNGTAWSSVTVPDPAGSAHPSELLGVSATPAATWAVGYYNTGTADKALTLRWNGSAWTQVRAVSPGQQNGSYLVSVTAVSANVAWAAGNYASNSLGTRQTLLERWNGTAWKKQPSPDPGGTAQVNELTAVASHGSDAGAVGYYNNGTVDQALAGHF